MRKKVFYLGIIFLILYDTVTSAPQEEKFKDMAAIPAGYFWMGVKDENEVKTAVEENKKLGYPLPAILFNREKPKHKVYLDAYFIDKYEVTNAEYKECVNAGKCKKPYDSKWYDSEKYGNHPVIWVDWHMADAYCKWAGKRLLTEAEWEKAARGENENIWPWGDVWDAQNATTQIIKAH